MTLHEMQKRCDECGEMMMCDKEQRTDGIWEWVWYCVCGATYTMLA